MQTFVITADINKPFAEWRAGFDEHASTRAQFGIVSLGAALLPGTQDNGLQRIVLALQAASQEALDNMIAAEADKIAATGHVLESTQVSVLIP